MKFVSKKAVDLLHISYQLLTCITESGLIFDHKD